MLIVVGVGPGKSEYMSVRAYRTIKNASKVYAFKRVKEELEDEFTHINEISVKDLKNITEGVLLLSGDPSFFGAVDYLKREGIAIDEVIPSITAFQYLMSKAQVNWNEAKTYSLHGRELDDGFKTIVMNNDKVIVLCDKDNNPKAIKKYLDEKNIKRKYIVGTNLSQNGEIIKTYDADNEIDIENSLSVVIIINEVV